LRGFVCSEEELILHALNPAEAFFIQPIVQKGAIMTHTTTSVVGIFKNYAAAQNAAQELRSTFPAEDVHVHDETDRAYSSGSGSRKESGITQFFRDLFGADDDSEARYYEDAVRHGNAIVIIDTDESRIDRAVEIMNRHGAVDIERDTGSFHGDGDKTRMESGERSIPVVQEELQVGKRAVQRGGVRIYSRVVDRPTEEQVTLREEHVRVERRPVNRPISAAEAANLRDETIEVAEMAEEPVVSKRARVVEEVSIDKQTTERKATVRDNVRRTDVTVEKLGREGTGATEWDTDFREDFERRYAGSGMQYENFAPAYEYGHTMASDPQYRGRSWEEVESTLRTDYLRNNPNSTWDNLKGAVRYGWEKVTGKRRDAS
jgi:uncharacterized protein (TIGR02271 family)